MKTLIIDGWEYTIEDEQKGKDFSEIEIPKEWELWTYEDCIKLHNSHRKELNLEDCWFFIKQPFEFNKENDYVARFYASSGRAVLSCDGGPQVSYSALGVRFKRRAKKLDAKTLKKINDAKEVIAGHKNSILESERIILKMENKIMELQQ